MARTIVVIGGAAGGPAEQGNGGEPPALERRDMEWGRQNLDHARNAANGAVISSDLARTTVMVVPTNEERVIARAARASRSPGASGFGTKNTTRL